MAIAAALVLGACMTPPPAPGQPRSEVLRAWGPPSGQYDLGQGAQRLEYATGPFGKSTWMVDLDAAGRVTGARQVLTESDAALVQRAFRRAGWAARVTPQVANWSIDVTDNSFAEFWAERPGQLRSTAKRKAAKIDLKTEIFDYFEAAAWDAYADVYADSWKPHEGSLDFLRAMAEEKGRAGALRLGIATLEGRAVAAQLWTVSHGRAIIHKLAHRQDVAELSPGTILSKVMFEHVIDRDRVNLIDFGTGDDRYKADWMGTRVMRMRVELYNLRSPRGVFGASKAWVRSLAARSTSG